MRSHTVEKIGGVPMSKFDVILDNVILGERKGDEIYNRIFVVSAYAGITNLLLEDKKNGEPGVFQRFKNDDSKLDTSLNNALEKMKQVNAGLSDLKLDVDEADKFVTDRVEGTRDCLSNLRQLCTYGHFQLSEYLPAAREMLSAIGEAHSAFNTVNILKKHSVKAVFIDLSGWKEEQNLKFDEKIRDVFEGIDVSSTLPIVTGYTKCAEGIMTTFDRGYSEITFSKIATISGAKEAIIHKEYHLSTGDPKIVGEENVRVIGRTNYDVADQLADLGMEAIHPKASKSMERNHIPIRIKNAFEPDHPGTLISSNTFKSSEPRVEMITGRKAMVGIEIYDPDMVGQSGYDYGVLAVFKKFNISYVAKNTNANTITHYIPKGTKELHEFLTELRQTLSSAEIRVLDVSIVSAIGSNMKVPGLLAKAANALAEHNINILALDQCMRQVNMQFVVSEKDFEDAIRVLHRGLVENG